LRLVLAAGAKKKPVLEAIRNGASYPIAQVTNGTETWWLIDREAAPESNPAF
jgi:6-phosphogluconolactonase/glucosamine-6-phosphate isomerase/deaminase